MSGHQSLLADLGLDVALHERFTASAGATYRRMILEQVNRPEGMAYFDGAVEEAHGARVQEIVDARRAGAKMLGTFCIYVPEEIVLAAGAIPVALCGGTAASIPYAERVFPRDICPMVKSTLGLAFSKTCPYAPIKDMGVGETTCDAKKKTWDVLAEKTNFHVLEVPQKKNARTRALWLEEVREFAQRVEALTGRVAHPAPGARGTGFQPVSHGQDGRATAGAPHSPERPNGDGLLAAIRLVNRKRQLLQELAELRKGPMPPISGKDALVVMQVALIDEPKRFCDALEALVAELRQRVADGVSPFPAGAPRLLVAGCPSVIGNWKIHHLIESAGAAVVCDETCTGTRYFENLVDETGRTPEEHLAAIANRYFDIDCACFTPNTERVEHVVELARACRADGVVQYTLQFCHGYNVESIRVARALKRAGIPSLEIVSDYSEEDAGQLRTRIEALLEGLRGERHG